jgi:hypothetical protein
VTDWLRERNYMPAVVKSLRVIKGKRLTYQQAGRSVVD